MAQRPLGTYAGFASVFGLALGGFLRTHRSRLPQRTSWGDVLLCTLATHKLSRLIAKDEVTTFIRAPVTVDEAGTEPEPTGVRHALGELVTCPYCLGLWIAAGFTAGTVALPRETRFVASVLAAHAGSDLLNAAFVRMKPG